MKRGSFRFSIAFLFLLAIIGLAQERQEVRPGLEHRKVSRVLKNAEGADEPVVMNLLTVDLRKVNVQIVHALDEAIGLETVSSMVARHGAAAGVNAGFFATTGTHRGDNVGTLVVNSSLLSEPTNNRAVVGFLHRGTETQIIFGHLKFAGRVETARGSTHALAGVNRARGKDELILYTPEFHRTTLTTPDGIEAVVRRGRIVRRQDLSGSNRIPEDGIILSASGRARDWVLKNLPVGARINLKTELLPAEKSAAENWKAAFCAVGGGPMLIRDGKIDITNEMEGIRQNFVTDRHPRTALAKLKDGRLLLAVVDGRQPGHSAGISLVQLAEILVEFGANAAINLDGGGSSAMVVEGKLVNKPSDAGGERAVSDALLLFEKPKARSPRPK